MVDRMPRTGACYGADGNSRVGPRPALAAASEDGPAAHGCGATPVAEGLQENTAMAWRWTPEWRAAGRLALVGAVALLAAAPAHAAPDAPLLPPLAAPQTQQCGMVPALVGTVAPAPWPPVVAGWTTPVEDVVILVWPPYLWYPVPLRVYTESTVCLWQGR